MAAHRNAELEHRIQTLLAAPLRGKDDLAQLFCKFLGFDYLGRQLSTKDKDIWGDGEAARLVQGQSFEILAGHGDVRAGGFAVVFGTLSPFNLSNQRTAIIQLRKTFPFALFLFANPKTIGSGRGAQVHLLHPKLSGGSEEDQEVNLRIILRRFRAGPGERYRTTAERLAKLDINNRVLSTLELTDLCNEVFDKEALTNEFFRKLDDHIRNVETDLTKFHKLDPRDAFSEAQLLIERLIFLYFAQNRGWLNQDASYLKEHFKSYANDRAGFGYYQEFLHLLFRSLAEESFGNRLTGVPFLNGGLFDDDEFKPDASKLCIRNETFSHIFDDLLEAYNFTVREDTPLSQEVAVDPEMLGKVFESIVLHAESAGEEFQAPDKRKATGSYYTPRIVVHFICRETLRLYFNSRPDQLADATKKSTWQDRISRLFKEIEAADGFSDQELKTLKTLLSPGEANRCLALLKEIRTLDPAVGSGAFPIGLLHELVSLQRIFEAVENGYKDPVEVEGSVWTQHAKEHFIQNSLFGVDIQQQAIEICRLRLWLSLLVDYELGVNPFDADRAAFLAAIKKISQLPNLEMNFKRGDSLHDFVCDVPVRIELMQAGDYSVALEAIDKLGAKLHNAKSAEYKRKLRLEIVERRLALGMRIVTDEVRQLRASEHVADNWFGESDSDAEKKRKQAGEIKRLEDAFGQLKIDETEFRKLQRRSFDRDFYRKLRQLEGSVTDGPFNFAWRIDFPHVLTASSTATVAGEMTLVNQAQKQQELVEKTVERLSGFDIVVGNPPFVTARNPIKRELYRERWPRVCHGKYLLVCPFFDLSFGLLTPGGQLGFIVSNAFAKREFGKPLVEDFFPTVALQKVIDCSGLLFPGHGTPTCIVLGRNTKPDLKSAIRVAAILPGGGDLRTPPEESPLWHTLAAQNDNPGFVDIQVVVADRSRSEMSKHPWSFGAADLPVSQAMEAGCDLRLRDLLDDDVGVCTMTNCDDVFVLFADQARRLVSSLENVRVFQEGDTQRNWSADPDQFALCPYSKTNEVLQPTKIDPETLRYLKPYKVPLEERRSFGNKTFKELGRQFYEFERMNRTKYSHRLLIPWSFVSTHVHATPILTDRLFKQSNMVASLKTEDIQDYLLVCAILNSSASHLWLKQVCYNKGAGEDEHRDRFEFSGTKVQQLPIPTAAVAALQGKSDAKMKRLVGFAKTCWENGQELPSLALRKLFERSGEGFHLWNATLPGYVSVHQKIASTFSSTASLRSAFKTAIGEREKLRANMIALQEEMDWLVYVAYGFLPANNPAGQVADRLSPLDRLLRPFCLWAQADGDFDKAVALIPSDWSADRKTLWKARIAAIRDNEHVRRIEQPVYKRRWDEQWKVGNRWSCGPVAYAAEFADAFRWWLEKTEWHLERKANGGPIALEDWTAALWKDARVQAAWPVAAEAICQVEKHKFDNSDSENRKQSKLDDSPEAFARYFKGLVNEESVPDGIPPAVSWEQLEKKMKIPAKVKSIRGKLNVPRERFRSTKTGDYIWAGKR